MLTRGGDSTSGSTWAVNWPALRGTLFDEFVLAHALGWWGKALAVRNGAMLWAISVLFELMELTFRVSALIAGMSVCSRAERVLFCVFDCRRLGARAPSPP